RPARILVPAQPVGQRAGRQSSSITPPPLREPSLTTEVWQRSRTPASRSSAGTPLREPALSPTIRACSSVFLARTTSTIAPALITGLLLTMERSFSLIAQRQRMAASRLAGAMEAEL